MLLYRPYDLITSILQYLLMTFALSVVFSGPCYKQHATLWYSSRGVDLPDSAADYAECLSCALVVLVFSLIHISILLACFVSILSCVFAYPFIYLSLYLFIYSCTVYLFIIIYSIMHLLFI